MSVTIQGNTSTVISNNSAPEGTSEIAKITRQIQVLTEKNEHQKRDLRIYPMNGYALNRIDLGFNLFYRDQASF